MSLGIPSEPPNGRGIRLLRLPLVIARCGRSRSSHFRDIADGLFTPGIPIGSRCTAWPEHEVDAILSAKVAGVSTEELRCLVERLVSARPRLMPDVRNPAARCAVELLERGASEPGPEAA